MIVEKGRGGGGSAVEKKATRLFVDSCLKLGGTMLEVWNPDGEKRSSSQVLFCSVQLKAVSLASKKCNQINSESAYSALHVKYVPEIVTA